MPRQHTQNNVQDITQFVNNVVRIKCERTVQVGVAWSPNRR